MALLIIAALVIEGCLAQSSSQRPCLEVDIARAEQQSRVIASAMVDKVLDDSSVQVAILRTLKGSSDLMNSIMILKGLRQECDLLREGDIRYFFMNSIKPGVMVSVRTPLTISLDHIDQLNSAVLKEPLARRRHMPDLPCELKYCPNNQECHEHQGQASCRCPDSCPYVAEASSVCASNNATFPSHCRLRLDSCRRSERIWVTRSGPCSTPPQLPLKHPFEAAVLTSY
ncbi:uncharacterized protein LOC108863890 [Galendromus occidentalis]|uniref:Uncharacterized protein LOC108863890 n=1 Tax=Galendromus occidentalis TaxID=34638 RepID=A0AAJ7L4R8_9ACAR|nr:uncharacterized protein LOC108863890 [Galendromus occidentalis]